MRLLSAPLTGCLLATLVFGARHYFPGWHQAAFLDESLLFLSGFLVGVRLPDFDLLLPGLSHRSAVTHSCLGAFMVQLLGYPAIAGGLALGIALHMSSDLQPKAWTGGALIKLPGLGSIGSLLSPLWLLGNIIGCFAVLFTTMEMEPRADRLAVLTVILMGGGWYFHQEEKKRLLPLVTLAFSLLLVHAYRDGRLTVSMVMQYLV